MLLLLLLLSALSAGSAWHSSAWRLAGLCLVRVRGIKVAVLVDNSGVTRRPARRGSSSIPAAAALIATASEIWLITGLLLQVVEIEIDRPEGGNAAKQVRSAARQHSSGLPVYHRLLSQGSQVGCVCASRHCATVMQPLATYRSACRPPCVTWH